MLEAYTEAELLINKVSPLLRGRLYTGLAEAYSNFDEEVMVRRFTAWSCVSGALVCADSNAIFAYCGHYWAR
jgi:hypothetical protein